MPLRGGLQIWWSMAPTSSATRANTPRRRRLFVVVRHRLGAPGLRRQPGLRAVRRLHLALLVAAQHQRMLGRGPGPAQEVFDLLDKLRVARDLEAAHPKRLRSLHPCVLELDAGVLHVLRVLPLPTHPNERDGDVLHLARQQPQVPPQVAVVVVVATFVQFLCEQAQARIQRQVGHAGAPPTAAAPAKKRREPHTAAR